MTAPKFASLALVMIGLCVALYFFTGGPDETTITPDESDVPVLVAFENAPPESFARIEVTFPGKETVSLVKVQGSGDWEVETANGPRPMNIRRETRLFYSSNAREKNEFRAGVACDFLGSNPERHGEFGFGELSPLVTFRDESGNQLEQLLVSRQPGPAGITYVRRADSDDVFSLPLPIHNNFEAVDEMGWRLQYVYPTLRADEVAEIIMEHSIPEKSFTLKRVDDNAWEIESPVFAGPTETNAKKVLQTLTRLRSAEALEFPENGQDLWNEGDVLCRLHLKTKAGDTTQVLEIGPVMKPGTNRLARCESLRDVFLLKETGQLIQSPSSYAK